MSESSEHLLETILRQCGVSAPEPWYPSAYVHATGMQREVIDPYLDQLRMGGLIRLTDWVEGKGQGYVLTEAGTHVLENTRQLARLRRGEVPAVKVNAEAASDHGYMLPSGWERGEAVRAAFMQPTTPVVTFGLILVNVLWFAAGLALAIRDNIGVQGFLFMTDPRADSLLHKLGALEGGDVYFRHEWWRLFTCCFVHIGLIHLAVNMYSLYVVGPLLERSLRPEA